jgi:hypothetical protein
MVAHGNVTNKFLFIYSCKRVPMALVVCWWLMGQLSTRSESVIDRKVFFDFELQIFSGGRDQNCM